MKQRIRFIYDHLGKFKKLTIFVSIITILYASVSLISTLVFGYIIDNVIDSKPIDNSLLSLLTKL